MNIGDTLVGKDGTSYIVCGAHSKPASAVGPRGWVLEMVRIPPGMTGLDLGRKFSPCSVESDMTGYVLL